MPRSLKGRALIGVAGIDVLLGIAFSSAAGANQLSPSMRQPMKAFHRVVPSPHRHRLEDNGASCNSSSNGFYAFDSTTTFTTNKVETFGSSTLAAADESGVFEGNSNTVCDYYSAIAGGSENVVDSGSAHTPEGAESSFIGAGDFNALSSKDAFVGAGYQNHVSGASAFVGAGNANEVSASYSAVGAGNANLASGASSFIGAGTNNEAENAESFVGAGDENVVSNGYAFIGAGHENSITGEGSFIGAGGELTAKPPYNQVFGSDSFLGTGDQNSVAANDAFIGSGVLNVLTAAAQDSVLAGGYGNTIGGQKASIGGGGQNDVTGSFATIPGGYRNEALGNESFAAGSQAEARYTGSFVWSDYVSAEKPQTDSHAGEFIARASGGVYFFSNAASSAGVHLAAGSGTWSSLSDRNVKTAILPLDDASILAKVAALPVSAWQYKTERGVRHVGPMAQDFYAAFGVGEDDRHITSIDEDGVALAAIKALHGENVRLQGENHRLQSRLTVIEARDADLARQVRAITRQLREGVWRQ